MEELEELDHYRHIRTDINIYTSVLLCIYMHRESGAICKVDPIVELI